MAAQDQAISKNLVKDFKQKTENKYQLCKEYPTLA
jgi:hypothetical protein